MKAEQHSLLEMYGNRPLFERRLSRGYNQVAFGGGEWVGNSRITAMWAFFHPSQKIATYEYSKFDDGEHTMRGSPFEGQYSVADFKAYCEKNKIRMGEKKDLAELVKMWK